VDRTLLFCVLLVLYSLLYIQYSTLLRHLLLTILIVLILIDWDHRNQRFEVPITASTVKRIVFSVWRSSDFAQGTKLGETVVWFNQLANEVTQQYSEPIGGTDGQLKFSLTYYPFA